MITCRVSRSLAALGPVLRSTLHATIDTEGVMRATNNVVSHAGKVANATATDEDDGVFLQVVSLAADVGSDFLAIGQPDTGHLAESRVGLLGRHGTNLQADTALLR